MEVYEPMLSQKGDKAILERPNLVGYLFEPCFEGIRVLVYKDKKDIAIFNRKKRDIINLYPEFLDLPAYIKTKSCILDGVLVVLNKDKRPDPELLQKREMNDLLKVKTNSKQSPATIFIFDILEKDGISLSEEPLKKRKIILKESLENGPNTLIVPYTLQGKDLWNQVKEQKLKGMIAKEMNSRYIPNKINWSWLEINNLNIHDMIIAGLTTKEKTKEAIKELILAVYHPKTDSFRYAGKIDLGKEKVDRNIQLFIKDKIKSLKTDASILNNDERAIFPHAIWLKPSIITKIKYKDKQDNELISPVITRLVSDKEPKDCRIEN